MNLRTVLEASLVAVARREKVVVEEQRWMIRESLCAEETFDTGTFLSFGLRTTEETLSWLNYSS